MPYPGEVAGKSGHADFIQNPQVQDFLEACEYLKEPSDEEAKQIGQVYLPAPTLENSALPRLVLASDASKSDNQISSKLPATQVSYVKVSHVLIDLGNYDGLYDRKLGVVDPFKVAELHKNARPQTFPLPGANIRYGGAKTVQAGFRKAIFDHFIHNRGTGSAPFVLLSVYRELLNRASASANVEKCPSCKEAISLTFDSAENEIPCPICSEAVYLTDSLRLHEGISDFGDNTQASTRFMNVLEHLLIVGFILQIEAHDLESLSRIAFVMDGPLAIFGQPAKLHKLIMATLHKVNERLTSNGFQPLLVIGLQKTGTVMNHAMLLQPHLPPNRIAIVSDEYRDKYIAGGEAPSVTFGSETYYGQDFIFKTARGRIFDFAIPYPFFDKSIQNGIAFKDAKADWANYGNLVARACDLIRHFEMDLYDNAIVPVALAHRHASISLVPGGKVLDLLTRAHIGKGC